VSVLTPLESKQILCQLAAKIILLNVKYFLSNSANVSYSLHHGGALSCNPNHCGALSLKQPSSDSDDKSGTSK
jgi:hypothetical protein